MHLPALAGFSAGIVVAGLSAVTLTHLDNNSSGAIAPASTGSVRSVSDPNSTTAKRVYDATKDSVVYISAQTAQGTATGSGFVVSSDGKIITNDHVVDGAQQVSVKIGTAGKAQSATVLAADGSKDLALLKVDGGGKSLHPLTFGNSSKVEVGDATYAIGNPYGLDHTFTSGIVSAIGRQIQAPDGTPIDNAIQTDAAINPGNSGGALLDGDGHVIGVNSQIASAGSSNGGESGNVGIGFAIPANTVKTFVANPSSTQSSQPDQSQADPNSQADPYSQADPNSGADPYGQADPNADPYSEADPYGDQSSDPSQSDPYGGTDPYALGLQ